MLGRMDFVLLHGTTQAPTGWARLIDVLERRGHRAAAVDFPTDRPELRAADYAGIARAQADDVREPVVLAHSGAGLLLPAVAEALGARHLVWLAAAVPDFVGGATFAEDAADPEAATDDWRAAGWESTEDPLVAAYFGFHDCDLRTLRWAVTTMRLFYPEAVYRETPPPAPRIPSTAVVPKDDRALRPSWLARIARERLGVEPIEIEGGHFPHVSRPEELADLLNFG